MATQDSVADILIDIQHKADQRCTWNQAWPMAPLFFLRLLLTFTYIMASLGLLPDGSYTTVECWINGLSALCLLALSKAHSRYGIAALLMGISMAFAALTSLMGSMLLLTVIYGLLIMVSNFVEYSANSKITEQFERSLQRKWNGLILWAFGTIFVGGFAFLLITVLSYVLEDLGIIILIVNYGPDLLVDILYLIYLACTICIIYKQGE